MLTTILNNLPPPKCIVIRDSITLKGKDILFSIINSHLKLNKYDVHLFTFEINSRKAIHQLPSNKLHVYDFVTNIEDWTDIQQTTNALSTLENSENIKGIVVIDSLAHLILEHGLTETYRVIHKLLTRTKGNIAQIATILHEDTIENKIQTIKYVDHIATLILKLNLISDNISRVEYLYKKPGGKIVKQVENYYFKNGILHTEPLEKVDAKVLLPNTTSNQLPENMSTFKISLADNEKKSREQLQLPYVKQFNIVQPEPSIGGNVIYNLDDEDDWDEEDPDDDLDI